MTLPPCRRCGAIICSCPFEVARRVVVEWRDPIRRAWGWSAAIVRTPHHQRRALEALIDAVGSRELVRVIVRDVEDDSAAEGRHAA